MTGSVVSIHRDVPEFPFPSQRLDPMGRILEKQIAQQSGAPVQKPLNIPAGFIRDYVDWATERTDAPPVFHLATGLSVLGTVLGNRLSLKLSHATIFPNLWIVLVAASSYMRKSTAIGFGTALIADLNSELLLPNQFSIESLIAVLAQRNQGLLTASEFGAFMSSITREYNAGAIPALTELYDVPPSFKRELRKEKYELKYPCLSLIGGSTINWLRQQIQADDLGGGFAARLTFWTAKEKLPFRDIDLIASESIEKRNQLLAKLKLLAQSEPRYLLIDADALRHYNDWCQEHELEDVSDQLRGLHVRLETVALKIAMIAEASFALGVAALPASISIESMTHGTELAEQLWENVQQVIEEGLGATKSFAQVERVRSICQDLEKKQSRFTYSDLLKRSHMQTHELRPIVQTLEETAELVRVAEAEPGKGRKGEVYSYHWPKKKG